MKVYFDGTTYRSSKITGPTHNILLLTLTTNEHFSEVQIIDIENKNDGKYFISQDDVKREVEKGLQEINAEMSVNYTATKIGYSSKDTPSNQVYYEITKEIIKAIVLGKIENPK